VEIAEANNILQNKSVLKFLDNIRKEYDNKLRFEFDIKKQKNSVLIEELFV
jgi:hypothetical protein